VKRHCLVLNLLSWRFAVECLIWPFVVVVVSEPPEPPLSTGPTAPPKRVKAVDSHGDGLKPFFDVVSLSIVELTAQFTTCITRISHQCSSSLIESSPKTISRHISKRYNFGSASAVNQGTKPSKSSSKLRYQYFRGLAKGESNNIPYIYLFLP